MPFFAQPKSLQPTEIKMEVYPLPKSKPLQPIALPKPLQPTAVNMVVNPLSKSKPLRPTTMKMEVNPLPKSKPLRRTAMNMEVNPLPKSKPLRRTAMNMEVNPLPKSKPLRRTAMNMAVNPLPNFKQLRAAAMSKRLKQTAKNMEVNPLPKSILLQPTAMNMEENSLPISKPLRPTAINMEVNPLASSMPQGNKSYREINQWLNLKWKSPTEEKQKNKAMNTENEFNIHIMIKKKHSKYKFLFKVMTRSVENLNQGYRCLELFRKAEKAAKKENEKSWAKGFSIGRVKFIIRNQFNEPQQLNDNVITPLRFASIVTLAANWLFRRILIFDSFAMKSAYQFITNPFAAKHGFVVNKVPETVEEIKLFYYYLTTTIGVHALMDIQPYICMAIAKWRFYGNNPKKLHLQKNVLFIDEAYSKCLRALLSSSYQTQKNVITSSCNPMDIIKNETLLRIISTEFEFLKTHATSSNIYTLS